MSGAQMCGVNGRRDERCDGRRDRQVAELGNGGVMSGAMSSMVGGAFSGAVSGSMNTAWSGERSGTMSCACVCQCVAL